VHGAGDDGEQLGQLVEGVAAQDTADPGDPRVGAHREQRAGALVTGGERGEPGLGVDDHRAGLQHPELGAVVVLCCQQRRGATNGDAA
jgi:hypothetical protein